MSTQYILMQKMVEFCVPSVFFSLPPLPKKREGQGFACLKHNSFRNVSVVNNESLAIGSPSVIPCASKITLLGYCKYRGDLWYLWPKGFYFSIHAQGIYMVISYYNRRKQHISHLCTRITAGLIYQELSYKNRFHYMNEWYKWMLYSFI